MAVTAQPVVKDGKFYHYYPKGRSGTGRPEWIYVRPAAEATVKTGTTSWPAAPKPAAKAAPSGGPPGAAPSSPQINPFLTASDLAGKVNFDFGNAQSLIDIDKGIADLNANVGLQRVQTDKQAAQGSSDTTDAMIGRGLFRSSIKDAALYDIEAQRTLQQKFFDTQITNAGLDADRRKKAIGDAQVAQQTALNQQAVENAQAASANQAVPVSPAAPAAAAKPKAAPAYKVVAGKSSSGTAGSWHVYPDGRKVFVARR